MASVFDDVSTRSLSIAMIVVGGLALIFTAVAFGLNNSDPTRGLSSGPGVLVSDGHVSLAPQPAGTILGVPSSGVPAVPEALGPFGGGSLIQGDIDGSLTELPIGEDGSVLSVENGVCTWINGPRTATLTQPTSSSGIFGNGAGATNVTITMALDGFNTDLLEAVVPFSASYTWLSDGASGGATTGVCTIPLDSVLPTGFQLGPPGVLVGAGSVVAAGAPAPPVNNIAVSSMLTATTLTLTATIAAPLVATDTLKVGVSGALHVMQTPP